MAGFVKICAMDKLQIHIAGQYTPDWLEPLKSSFSDNHIYGSLYVSYPIFKNGELLEIDVVYVGIKGIYIFVDQPILPTGNINYDLFDSTFLFAKGILESNKKLVNRRTLNVPLYVIGVVGVDNLENRDNEDYLVLTVESVVDFINEKNDITSETVLEIDSEIQQVAKIGLRPYVRKITHAGSKGEILNNIDSLSIRIDSKQNQAAKKYTDGPQRIRGLAGSGKTVVLALKASILHAMNPEAKILVTFYSRALKQQYVSLITKFYITRKNEEPNWSNLKIMHAWGDKYNDGFYTETATVYGFIADNYQSAKLKYGYGNEFNGVFDSCLTYMKTKDKVNHMPYDYILIDEAQDLPRSFFEACFLRSKPPHRIIWAYDELQNLNNLQMAPPEELFGKKEQGISNISSAQLVDDIVLEMCYRNHPNVLTLAHAVGFGIYRSNDELVQMFSDYNLWKEVGYEEINNLDLLHGTKVELKRTYNSAPDFFYNTEITNLIKFECVDSIDEQYAFVAKEIHKNITEEDLNPQDIMVILPNVLTAKSQYFKLQEYLEYHKIDSVLAGFSTDIDVFSEEGKVTCTQIFRAKGNEAAMVYILDADWCMSPGNVLVKRNILFTAMTRSRLWLRVYGTGDKMNELIEEYLALEKHGFRLSFTLPTIDQLDTIKQLSVNDHSIMEREAQKIMESIKTLPIELQQQIKSGIK